MISSYMTQPGETQANIDARRKMALALAMQSGQPQDIRHWTQGLAQLANAGISGYELYNLDKQDREEAAKGNELMARMLSGGAAPSAPPVMPTPSRPAPPVSGPVASADPAPITGPRPGGPVMPSDKVWGDAEAESAGLYETPAKNVKLASALAAPAPAPAAPMPPGPQVAQAAPTPAAAPPAGPNRELLVQMLANRRTAPIAQQIISAQIGQQFSPKTTDEIREFEYAQKNPAFKDYKTDLKRAGAIQNSVVVDQKGELEFSKVAGKKQAERFDELASDGQTAKQMISDVKTLTELGKTIGTGKGAEAKAVLGPYAEALGIKIEGLSEIQAFEAIVNRVAPSLRVKGSGAQSDFELKNFLKSLPTLGNTPEGNEIAAKTIEGLYQNKVRASEIGAAALAKRITPEQAEKMIRELPDPMEGYRAMLKKQQQGGKSNLKQKYGLD